MSGSLLASLPPPPHPEAFTFLAGLAVGWAAALVMLAPILAKGMEARHNLSPSRRRRRRMILGYCGMAVGALCIAVSALMAGTPLYGTLQQLFVLIAGSVLGVVSSSVAMSARSMRELEPLAGRPDAPDESASPGPDGPHAT